MVLVAATYLPRYVLLFCIFGLIKYKFIWPNWPYKYWYSKSDYLERKCCFNQIRIVKYVLQKHVTYVTAYQGIVINKKSSYCKDRANQGLT